MSHHHGHGGLGAFAVVAAIAFAFGSNVARVAVGTVLLLGAALFVWIAVRTVMGL